jgi:hypothetical protein
VATKQTIRRGPTPAAALARAHATATKQGNAEPATRRAAGGSRRFKVGRVTYSGVLDWVERDPATVVLPNETLRGMLAKANPDLAASNIGAILAIRKRHLIAAAPRPRRP